MAQARSIQMHTQEDSENVAPSTPAISTGLQAAVAFRAGLTPQAERAGAGGGTAGGGTRFAYQNLGGDTHGFGDNYQGRVRSLTHVNAGATVARANTRLMIVEDDTEPITIGDEAMEYNGSLMDNGVDQLAVEQIGDEVVEIRDDDENMPWDPHGRHLYSNNSRGPLPHRSGFLHQHGMSFAPSAPLPIAANHAVPPFHRVPQPVDIYPVNVVPHTYENGPGYVRGAVGTAGMNNIAAERTYERRRR